MQSRNRARKLSGELNGVQPRPGRTRHSRQGVRRLASRRTGSLAIACARLGVNLSPLSSGVIEGPRNRAQGAVSVVPMKTRRGRTRLRSSATRAAGTATASAIGQPQACRSPQVRAWKLFLLLPRLLFTRGASRGAEGKAELLQCRPLGGAAGPSARPSTWREHLGAAHVGSTACACVRPGPAGRRHSLQHRWPRAMKQPWPPCPTRTAARHSLEGRTAKKGTAAGLSGATVDHYKILLADEATLALFAEAATKLANADVPEPILAALALARLTALQKPSGGARGIATVAWSPARSPGAMRAASMRPPGRTSSRCKRELGRQRPPSRVEARARCKAALSSAQHLRRQPASAARRTAGGARSARRRTKRSTKPHASGPHRPPVSQARTTSRCGPGRQSSGYRASLRRRATAMAAPSSSAARGCCRPSRRSGATSVASQHSASPKRVAP